MSSLRCGFGFTVLSEEEELEFEQAAIATVKQSSENCENLVTSRLRVHNKSSAAFLKGCSVVRAAAFFGGLFTAKSSRKPSLLPFLHTFLPVYFLSARN